MITCLIQSVPASLLKCCVIKSDVLAERGLLHELSADVKKMNVRRLTYAISFPSLPLSQMNSGMDGILK